MAIFFLCSGDVAASASAAATAAAAAVPSSFIWQGERIVKAIPLRRLGDLRELDGLLLMLASESASSYMTGSVLALDGGLMLSHM